MLRLPRKRRSRRRRKIEPQDTPHEVPQRKPPETAITKGNMQVRVVTLAVLVAVCFVVLAGRLWYLQVLTGEDYELSAQETQTREVKIPAQRGVVYDRDGEVLASNVPGMNVTVIPSYIERGRLEELVGILDADEEAVLDRYDVARENNPYASMLVKENADRDAVTYISERTEEFPGVTVGEDFIRDYPKGEFASHVLGSTGPINEEEMELELFENLDNDAIVGKGGVELAYEDVLRGEPGSNEYSVDALGRVVTVRRADGTRADGRPEISPELGQPDEINEPVPGDNLVLTLDLGLQEVVERELDAAIERARTSGGSGKGGAAMVLDPESGEILAMTSRPTFDPQLFVGGITGEEEVELWEYLNSDEANFPFTNRAIAGSYPAASTFKVFTGIAGFTADVITPWTTFNDTGECWRPRGAAENTTCWQSWRQNGGFGDHGVQNYAEAIEDSNNKFFYQVADWIWNRGGDENLLPELYERFGFGSPTGIDLPGERSGTVPDSQWQQDFGQTLDDQRWHVGRWINMSIGQGDLAVTPLQIARGYAAIQNGGTLVTPHVGKEIQKRNGDTERIEAEPGQPVEMDETARRETIRGMLMVTEEDGTAADSFAGSPLDVAGKSGTGELYQQGEFANWFVGWAEDEENPVVVVVMVEGGGAYETGSDFTVAPAVRGILEEHHGVAGQTDEPQPAGQDPAVQPPAGQAPAGQSLPEPSTGQVPGLQPPADQGFDGQVPFAPEAPGGQYPAEQYPSDQYPAEQYPGG